MPRPDDDFDDDRPRRRPRDEDEDDRPARRRRNEDDDYPPRKKSNAGLIVGILVGAFVLCCGGGGFLAYFVVRGAKEGLNKAMEVVQEANEAQQSETRLTEIGTAMQKHHDALATFPNNSFETGGNGSRPLLSWRVHLLPYLGQDALYKQFKLDEPWDSPNNIKLLTRMPDVYGSPEARKKAGDGKTFYRGFTAPGGIFEKPPRPGDPVPRIKITDIPDGTVNTILVIDAGEAVEWTKPDDLDFSPGRPRPALGGAYPNFPQVVVLMADGKVRMLTRSVPDQDLRLLIDRKDGKPTPAGWLQ
ncbi:MAG: DUF1559 domain-containing protein [Zavarzinella sp.]|nr:DUF1559 domain-containing protein [Zavarzinella sp.]